MSSQVVWPDGFKSCNTYMLFRVKDPKNSKYYSWWISNGGDLNRHTVAQSFNKQYEDFFEETESDELREQNLNTLLHSDQEELDTIFMECDIDSPNEFYARINAMRNNLGLPMIDFDRKKMMLAEKRKMLNESKKFREDFRSLVKMGLTFDDIYYAGCEEDALKTLLARRPELVNEIDPEDFYESYFKALDYVDHRERVALIDLELAPIESNRAKMSKSSTYPADLGNFFFFHSQVLIRSKNISSLVDRMNNIFKVIPRIHFIQLTRFY